MNDMENEGFRKAFKIPKEWRRVIADIPDLNVRSGAALAVFSAGVKAAEIADEISYGRETIDYVAGAPHLRRAATSLVRSVDMLTDPRQAQLPCDTVRQFKLLVLHTPFKPPLIIPDWYNIAAVFEADRQATGYVASLSLSNLFGRGTALEPWNIFYRWARDVIVLAHQVSGRPLPRAD